MMYVLLKLVNVKSFSFFFHRTESSPEVVTRHPVILILGKVRRHILLALTLIKT